MTRTIKRKITFLLPGAVLALGFASAHAASTATWLTHQRLNPGQETMVTAGMSESAVRQALGAPARIHHYGDEPGPTWTYDLTGSNANYASSMVVFDVDFGANGQVVSSGERELYGR
jgi:hypothetical protein